MRISDWSSDVCSSDLANQVAACDGHETIDAEWIAPRDVLRLAGSGERTVIFPTRMNVQLLSEASDASDCLRRAEERPLVTVLPRLEERNGQRVLVIPDHAGYGPVVEIRSEEHTSELQ